jgi:peroxiredoxin
LKTQNYLYQIRILSVIVLSVLSLGLLTSCSSSDAMAQIEPGAGEAAALGAQSGMEIPKEGVPEIIEAPTEEVEQDVVESSAPQPKVGVVEGGGDTVEDPPQVAGQQQAAEPAPAAEPTAAISDEAPPAASPDLPVKPQIGFLAPDFSLQTPDGQTVRLSEMRGTPVVISYWASWCGPCKHEMGILQGVYQESQGAFMVFGVNAIQQDSLNDVQAMVAELGVTFPILLDEGDQFADSYQALFFPTTYFIDARGVIVDIALGDSPEDQFRARVDRFMAGGE